eukprot:4358448-Karenia_brevis.AAC.1
MVQAWSENTDDVHHYIDIKKMKYAIKKMPSLHGTTQQEHRPPKKFKTCKDKRAQLNGEENSPSH